ncbi:MAG: hypothetical protein CMO40_09820 [Verrucomicrobiaceae bacterium]|nr:hypothetical protein [Verrucomicrobiaceae bacterium]
MSRPVLSVIAVILILGLGGGAVLGWLYWTRDRVALLTYRVQLPEEISMREVVANEKKLLHSDEVLKPVIESLNLVEGWGMDSENEALEHMRAKLIVREDRVSSQVRVIYRDRKQERALDILNEINDVFSKVRSEAARRREFPQVIPMKKQEGPQEPDPVPEAATP